MNKQRYRIIFNKKRGQMMVVGEIASTDGKSGGASSRPGRVARALTLTLRPLAFSLYVALGLATITTAPAFAQVVAYKTAPASQQPTILSAGNGVPLINIQTPSAAGVSRNTYSQFDVQQQGAILNNSRTNTQTQLGGWVQGNPWLAGGTARVILNEVISVNPSQLLGYVEVAGNRAQIVIANPAGVTCNGCGFINANRVTLTTGTPILSGGNLDGYRVEGGNIRVEGSGMDASGASYTDLIARAVQINAGLWAQNLSVTTGANQVNAAHTQATPIAGSGAAPAFAVDVAQLGGMYANKITLVGTEAGVGVRNAGTIAAAVGEIMLTTDGQLINKGTLISGDNTLSANARSIDNTGTLSSGGNLVLGSLGDLTNTGLIHADQELRVYADGHLRNQAGTFDGQRLEIRADRLTNDKGSIRQNGTQALSLSAGYLTNSTDALIGNITPTAGSGTTTTDPLVATPPTTAIDQGVTIVSTTAPTPLADGQIIVRTGLINTEATIAASGNFAVNALQGLSNAGTLTLDQLNVAGNLFQNTGTIAATDVHLDTATADNSGGTLGISRMFSLKGGDFTNAQGVIRHAGTSALSVELTGHLDNRNGQIASNGITFDLSAASIDNAEGHVEHAGNGSLNISTGRIDGKNGHIESAGALILNASDTILDGASTLGSTYALSTLTLSNQGGRIVQTGQGESSLFVGGRFDNRTGTLASAGSLDIKAGEIDNRSGKIVSNNDLALTTTAGHLANDGGAISSHTKITAHLAGDLSNANGQFVAGTDITLSASGAMSNRAGTFGAVTGQVDATLGGALDNTGGRIEAAKSLVIAANGLTNIDGTLLGQSILLDAALHAVDNTRGTLAAADKLTVSSGELNNGAGYIQATGELLINTHGQALLNSFNGSGGSILGQSTVTLNAGKLDNHDGNIQAGGDLAVNATILLDNTDGLMRTGSTLRIDTPRLINVDTNVTDKGIEGTAVNIAAHEIDNRNGALRANTDLTISSTGTLDNSNGLISSTETLAVADASASRTLAITNTGGTLLAGTQLAMRADRLSGDGKLLSHGDISVDLVADLVNTGEIAATGNAGVTTAGTLTNSGSLQAGDTLTLLAGTLDNTATGKIVAGKLNLKATDTHTLTNRGLIDSGDTTLDAITLNNLGTGRIYGDHLSIAATTLNNLAENGAAPVIAARGRLDIGAGTINNHDGALIFSAGDMVIGGNLDGNRHAAGQTGSLINESATIEALGDLGINAASLINRKRAFATTQEATAYTPSDIELLDFASELAFHWPIAESGATTWRDYIRERYLNVVAKLLGGGPDEMLVTMYNIVADGGGGLSSRRTEFVNVWGNLTGYAGQIGGGLSSSERDHLAAVINSRAPASFADSHDMWKLLVDTIAAEHPEYINQMAQSIRSQGGAQRTYRQVCQDPYDDCSYVVEVASTYAVTRDVISVDSPASVIRAGGNASIATDTLDNRYSVIQSGRDMVLTGTTLTNMGAELNLLTDITSTSRRWHWVNRDHGATASASSTQTLIGSVPGIISAGGTLTGSFTSRIDNVTIRQNAAPVVGQAGSTPSASGTTNITTGTTGTGASVFGSAPGAVVRVSTASTANGPAMLVATAAPTLSLPMSRLLHLNPDPAGTYLIETDPAFANYRQWLSSDYMLQALSLDPAVMQKRLGDGFYEQRLVTEQVAQLTGRRFLSGYASDEDQYRALMNAGVTLANSWGLIPGVELSAAQMAQLTTDIVWLVEKDVDLGNGQTGKALIPQLYVRVRDGDLSDSGTLIAANDLSLDVAGDLINSGTIAGRQIVALTAENLGVLRGRVTGRDVAVQASRDLTLLGGTLEAERSLVATAGHDLTVASTTADRSYRPSEGAVVNAAVQRSVIDRVAGLYVTGDTATGQGGTLVASAGNDMALLAAALVNVAPSAAGTPGSTRLTAGNDLILGTVTESNDAATRNKGNRWHLATTTDIGSTLNTDGSLTLQAGHDVSTRAANATADGALSVTAGNDLTIGTGQATLDTERWHKSTKSGLLSSRVSERLDTRSDTATIASTLSGDTLTLVAGQDITVTGSNLVATGDLTARAGRDLTIESAQETHGETHYHKTKESGLFSSGGLSVTIGKREMKSNLDVQSTTAAASTVGSLEGNVTLTAGQNYQQTGSDLIALKGDINVVAEDIAIREARETSRTTFTQKTKQSGLTLSISNPVISAVQTIAEVSKAAGDTRDPRMQALAAGSAALAGYSGTQALIAGQGQTVTIDGITKDNQIVTDRNVAGDPIASHDATTIDQIGGINLGISLGSSKSKSSSTQTSDTAAGSTLAAARDITLTATGKEGNSTTGNILIQGSDVTAGHNLSLIAQNDIELLAAANAQQLRSSNKSSSASIGISIGTVAGLAITASASQAKGRTNGDDLLWTNTHLTAGEKLTLKSGNDTTLRGATASGKQVTADIGGDLSLESLQDTSTYDSKQKSGGFSIAVSPVGVPVGGSLSGSKSKIASDYRSVIQQTALKAGDEGFDIHVSGNTDLKGAAITSTQSAVDQRKNTFNTEGELTLSDLHNEATYDAKGGSITLGTQLNEGKYTPQGTSAGYGEDEGHAESTTYAAITGYAGNSTARTGDPETGLDRIFDADKVQKEIDAQVKITQAFGQLAPKAAADFANARVDELRKQGDFAEAAKWKEGGIYRIALHTAIGGLAGGTPGALGAGAAASAAPLLNEFQSNITQSLKDAGANGKVAEIAGQLISGSTAMLIGRAASGGNVVGGATAFNADFNNRQLHRIDITNAKKIHAKAQKDGKSFTLAQIEDALRWGENSQLGETALSNTLINPALDVSMGKLPNDPVGSVRFDAMAPGTSSATTPYLETPSSNGTVYVQNMAQVEKPSAELMAYIQENTGGANSPYSWKAATLVRPDPDANMAWTSNGNVPITNGTGEMRYSGESANGKYSNVPTAYCPPAGCTGFDAIAGATTDKADQRTLADYQAALDDQSTKVFVKTGIFAGTMLAAPPTLGGSVWGGAVIGGGSSLTDQLVDTGSVDVGKTVFDTTLGAGFGLLGYGAFSLLGKGWSSFAGAKGGIDVANSELRLNVPVSTTLQDGTVLNATATPTRILAGDPDKVAIIGRSMDAVNGYASALRSNGIEPYLFSSSMESGMAVPTIARREFSILSDAYGGTIPDSVLPSTKMFQTNEAWAQLLKHENYTVIDLGNPFNNPKSSPFFNMEQRVLFGGKP